MRSKRLLGVKERVCAMVSSTGIMVKIDSRSKVLYYKEWLT